MGSRLVAVTGEMAGNRPAGSMARTMLMATVAAISLSGCGVYMHDASLETSTAQAKASFDELKTPELFEAQRVNLLESARQEDQAVAGYAAALRNEAVLTLLRPSGVTTTKSDAGPRLLSLVNAELEQVYGMSQVTGTDLRSIENVGETILLNRHHVANLNAKAESQRRDFQRLAPSDRRPTGCDVIPPPPPHQLGMPPAIPAGASEADRMYLRLQASCEQVRNARKTPVLPRAEGEIGRLRKEVQDSAAGRDASARRADALKAEIAAALKSEKEDPTITPTDLGAKLQPLLTQFEEGPPLVRMAGLEEIAQILETRVVGELRSLKSELGDNAQAVAALAFIGASEETANAFAAKPNQDRAAALLIGLATVRHRLNMAQADVALEEKTRDNLDRQLAAVLIRASHLARAKSILERNPPTGLTSFADARDLKDKEARTAATEALTAYIAAWNNGEIPYHVLRFRAVQDRRMAALERAQLAEQDYRAVVRPAVDTLAEYGAGGITPESIVTLLGHLGISGSILAK